MWVAPTNQGEFDVPFAAKIMKLDKNRILILDDDGMETWISPKVVVKAMHATSFQHVEDMISLGDLQECSILRNLKLRYRERKIYVRSLLLSGFISMKYKCHLLITSRHTPAQC